MPYKIKGKCIYKKDTNKKVGCTKGSVKKYMKALHANVKESLNECYDYKNTVMADDKSEAVVFFRLTKSYTPAEIGMVFSMPDADYQYSIIRSLKSNLMHKFEDPNKAVKLLKTYGLTPHDVENEMYQQAYEQIEKHHSASKIDDGVREESLEFETLVAKILTIEKE
jgi:hypothetical protein